MSIDYEAWMALQRQVRGLEEVVMFLSKANEANIPALQEDSARFRALQSIVQELAQKQGITAESFYKHVKHRQAFYYEQEVLHLGDTDPVSAETFDRRPHPAEPIEGFPPLFPESEG
jgi:hypothetical protein